MRLRYPLARTSPRILLGAGVLALSWDARAQDERRENEPGNLFGNSIASVGDVDGDGVRDFVVGCPLSSEGYESQGRAWLVSTKKGKAIFEVSDGEPGSFFGDSVAGPGDTDGDGTPDFIVTAPSRRSGGVLRSYSGKTGTLLHEVPYGPREKGPVRCDLTFCPVGDANGDGCADYAMACMEPEWRTDGRFPIRIYSGKDASILVTVHVE